ncbi:MAG: hypothetical protein M3Z31_04625 [Pseudomonadota bacterium]|nr:hypothetical protein [Pseudomonadota bacterium]
MSSRHNRSTTLLMTKAAELAFAVPPVVAHRVTRMAIAGPVLSERDRKEFHGMAVEKTAAFAESWNAMAMQTMRANQALGMYLIRSFWSSSRGATLSAQAVAAQMNAAALGILGKGVAPVHRRAVANARRLARTKLR